MKQENRMTKTIDAKSEYYKLYNSFSGSEIAHRLGKYEDIGTPEVINAELTAYRALGTAEEIKKLKAENPNLNPSVSPSNPKT